MPTIKQRIRKWVAPVLLAASLSISSGVLAKKGHQMYVEKRKANTELVQKLKEQKLNQKNIPIIKLFKINPKNPHDIITLRYIEQLSTKTGLNQTRLMYIYAKNAKYLGLEGRDVEFSRKCFEEINSDPKLTQTAKKQITNAIVEYSLLPRDIKLRIINMIERTENSERQLKKMIEK